MCANSWVENWVRTTQNRQQNMEPLALLLPLKVLITGMVRGQKTQTSVQSDKRPHQFYSLPNGRFRRNSSEESLQSLRPRHLIIHNTFLPDKCWHVAALAHAHKCALWRVSESAWDGLKCWCESSKTARQGGRKGAAMSSPSDRISQSNSVDPRLLLRLTLHWAVSLPWREWWMDPLFILTPS